MAFQSYAICKPIINKENRKIGKTGTRRLRFHSKFILAIFHVRNQVGARASGWILSLGLAGVFIRCRVITLFVIVETLMSLSNGAFSFWCLGFNKYFAANGPTA
jgi:hypothetical protein